METAYERYCERVIKEQKEKMAQALTLAEALERRGNPLAKVFLRQALDYEGLIADTRKNGLSYAIPWFKG